MSYLSNALRLHFAGRFQATVSTVNNDVTHFNNDTFKPRYQERMADNGVPMNGWWNPAGDGVWRLLGCDIAAAYLTNGTPVTGTDPILGMSVADSDKSAPAKIVDLDPEQQMVSTLFGLTIRIADRTTGHTLMEGSFDPAAFTELWSKIQSSGGGGDMAYGAMWQSVIHVTYWADVSGSKFLTELKHAAQQNSNLLSIKFNVDCFNMNWPVDGQPGNDNFCRGRVVGTIGPATPTEPRHFVLGRQLVTQQQYPVPNNQPPPVNNLLSYINYCAAVVDSSHQLIRLDLGNALPIDGTGKVINQGVLNLVVTVGTTVYQLGTVDYTKPDWYQKTAGIVEIKLPDTLSLPGPVPLTVSTATTVANNPLGLTLSNPISSLVAGFQTPTGVLTGELPASPASDGTVCPGGLYVRADLFVFRLSPQTAAILDPNAQAAVSMYATVYGQPYGKQVINFALNPSGLQGGRGLPPVGTPASGLTFPSSVTTDANGHAFVQLTGGNPENARGYIDGQVYGVGYALANQGYSPAPQAANQNPTSAYQVYANSWNFISVLVFDVFTPDNPVTWYGSMQPIFQQYANLYPVMNRFVNLGDYQQVKRYARMLTLAFGLPEGDPNAMPVTRDLSPAKRRAILAWLANPLEGTAPSSTTQPAVSAPPPWDTGLAAQPGHSLVRGGKAAALSRMIKPHAGLH